MDNKIKVTINDKEYFYDKGITLLEISKNFSDDFKFPILAGYIHNELFDLNRTVDNDCKIRFIDCTAREGNLIYQKTLIFIMAYAARELFGIDNKIYVCHSIDKSKKIETSFNFTPEMMDKLKAKMKEIIANNMSIDKCLVKRNNAEKYFEEIGLDKKAKAISFINNDYVNLYKLGNYYNTFYSVMPINTSVITAFDLKYFNHYGFILLYPNATSGVIENYEEKPKVANAYLEAHNHLEKLNMFSSVDINKAVTDGRVEDIIKLEEVIASDRLLELAKEVYDKRDKIKIVLIAGPSSAGKTTTARKLSMFLKSYGLNPKPLSVDDYFIDRERTPKLPNGEYDFESLRALKVELFNEHLVLMLKGVEVEIPTYNFKKGEGEFLGNKIKLNDNDILIIEGLHALNEELTSSIPKESKYKVYVSPFTDMNIDIHNVISTTDLREIRRMVRDNRTRGYKALDTLKVWNNVRAGEEKYIYPYQEEADFVYNTFLLYEIGVLRLYAEPLLYDIGSDSPYYEEVKRLKNLLAMFMTIPTDAIPNDSILREYIGNSYFE